jgi:hypothetical protein
MNFGNSSSETRQMSAAMRKIQEDPLFLIRKEEAKHHKSLMDNPLVRERVKMLLKSEKEREARKVKEETGLDIEDARKRSRTRPAHESPNLKREELRHHDRNREFSRSLSRDDRRYRHRSHSPAQRRERRRSRSPDERRRRSPSRDWYRQKSSREEYSRRRYN